MEKALAELFVSLASSANGSPMSDSSIASRDCVGVRLYCVGVAAVSSIHIDVTVDLVNYCENDPDIRQ